jgi:phosphoribosyl-ATP pyrophosphohydrolase/phosphoribosyl-AMP cyclohydrolase
MSAVIENLKLDAQGLIPAVVQDVHTKEVLMVAYMNQETVQMTLETGKATFWSRSRQQVWVKGETSGNYLNVKQVRVDCDADCLMILAEPEGPACHTGNRSCFYRKVEGDALVEDTQETGDILMHLCAVTEDRKKNPQPGSYTNYLLEKGEDKILKKVGEEAAEVVIAGKNRSKEEISYEVADLMYHLSVMLVDNGMSWAEIYEELEKRR